MPEEQQQFMEAVAKFSETVERFGNGLDELNQNLAIGNKLLSNLINQIK